MSPLMKKSLAVFLVTVIMVVVGTYRVTSLLNPPPSDTEELPREICPPIPNLEQPAALTPKPQPIPMNQRPFENWSQKMKDANISATLKALSMPFDFKFDTNPVPPVQNADLPIKPNTTAVCIAGVRRSFGDPRVMATYQRDLIGPLIAGMDVQQLDAYVVLAMQESRTRYTFEDLQNALHCVNPKAVIIEDFHPFPTPSSFDCKDPDLMPMKWTDSRNRWAAGYFRQFIKVNRCYQLMLDQERKQGYRYEWMIRTRPDLIFYEPLKTSLLQLNKSHVFCKDYAIYFKDYFKTPLTSMADFWAAMHRDIAHVYFNAHRFYYDCAPRDEVEPHCQNHWRHADDKDFPPECYLAWWIKKKFGLVFGGERNPLTLLREDGENRKDT